MVLQLENIALRHQLAVLRRSAPGRLRLNAADRLLWIWLSRICSEWRSWLVIVQPETVVSWHRRLFRVFWDVEGPKGHDWTTTGLQRGSRIDPPHEPGNPTWGAPRIHGELLKLGIEIGGTSVSKYLVRNPRPPSQTWRTFLENHTGSLVSVDFFTVPTIRVQLLYVFLVLAHDRCRIIHFAVTAHPTAEWTTDQLREAFPSGAAPAYLLRDRDRIFGASSWTRKGRGIKQVLSAPGAPWQRAYVERVIGTIFAASASTK